MKHGHRAAPGRDDDPSQRADAALPKDAGHSGAADRSGDAGRSGEAERSGEAGRPEDASRSGDAGPSAYAGRPEDAGRSEDAGHSGDTYRSRDSGRSGEADRSGEVPRSGEPPPEGSARESPETTDLAVKRAESRSRSEYADDIAPSGSSPIDGDPPKHEAEEPDRPEDRNSEATRLGAERSGEFSTENQKGPDQLRVANDFEGSDEHPPSPDNQPADPAEPEESDNKTTDDENEELPAEADKLGSPGEDEPQGLEETSHNVLERLLKAHATDLATDHANTTDPDNKQWTAERNRIHGEIVSDLYTRASTVPCEYKAIMAGGLPGAGKTTILTEQAGIDPSKYLTINPDEIKEVLASRDLIPEIEGLSPMEASDLAHEESSVIAKHLAHRAQAEGKNIIWDITMSRLESTKERIDSLRASGYDQIDAIFVDIPIEVSIRRTQARHREGQESWQAGRGMGGRFVPPEIIRKQADPEWGSKNKRTFEDIKQSVNNWTVLDNGVDGRRAILVDSNEFHETSQNSYEKRPG